MTSPIRQFFSDKLNKKPKDIETQIDEAVNLGEEDKEILKGVFSFGSAIVREVMIPRTDMITLEHDENIDDALKLFIRSGFSRIPILGEDADQIIGIAYFKDVVEELYLKKSRKTKHIDEISRDAYFIPETKMIDDLFREMQKNRSHIALVVDEYGGIAGLVTLEDLIEEIVGDLDDEHDQQNGEEDVYQRNEDGDLISLEVGARFLISDIEEAFNVTIEHDAVDTVLGLLTQEIRKVPIRGSEAIINGLKLEAIKTAGRRKQVSRIKISLVSE